jgi:hypothetical protein
MTSTIKVNNIQNQCGANIINESSNTITIGASGDTIALASGASQTGFGRTGTVDWQTTAKTGDFTAVNGEGYFVDTGGGVVTATLPASPSAGNIVYIKDYDGNFGTNKCTVARNGSNIRGAASDFNLEKGNAGAVFIYVDATEGWQIFIDGSNSDAQASFIEATGGTITTSGDCKIHTFTGPGTFTVTSVACAPADNIISYTVVAGGGGGGGGSSGSIYGGGGGGAGGFREVNSPSAPFPASPLDGYPTPANRVSVTATSFPITVGAGGAGGCKSTPSSPNARLGANGSNSVFSTITSAGGGVGGTRNTNAPGGPSVNFSKGAAGGSGGGSTEGPPGGWLGGAGNTPPTTPAQGSTGGASGPSDGGPFTNIAGGGGATQIGQAGGGTSGGDAGGAGGAGATNSITGSPVARAGGGGGGGTEPNGAGGAGGTGGGAAGATNAGGAGVPGPNGTANTGGGGGGGSGRTTGCGSNGGTGGSGIVIIRYKFQ